MTLRVGIFICSERSCGIEGICLLGVCLCRKIRVVHGYQTTICCDMVFFWCALRFLSTICSAQDSCSLSCAFGAKRPLRLYVSTMTSDSEGPNFKFGRPKSTWWEKWNHKSSTIKNPKVSHAHKSLRSVFLQLNGCVVYETLSGPKERGSLNFPPSEALSLSHSEFVLLSCPRFFPPHAQSFLVCHKPMSRFTGTPPRKIQGPLD